MSKSKLINKKTGYILVCVLSIAYCFLPLMKEIIGKLVSDNMGCLRLVMDLANCPGEFDSVTSYYGQFYYIIFFLVFKMTSNPYDIYLAIIYGNALFRALTGILIYKIQTDYLSIDYLTACLLTVIALGCFPGNSITRFNNETPLFILLYAVLFFALWANNISGKAKYILYVLILLLCGYGLLIHTRWILFFFCIYFVLILNDLIYKKNMVALKLSPASLIVLFVGRKIVKIITNYLHGSGTVRNSSLEISKYAQSSAVTLDGALMIVFSNIYRLLILTYGIPLIAFAVFGCIAFLYFRSGREKFTETISSNQFIVFMSSILAIIGSVAGLVFYYGSAISKGLLAEKANKNFSGIGYDRYYLLYAGALIIAVYSILMGRKISKRLMFSCIGIFIALYKIVTYFYYEAAGNYNYLYSTGSFTKTHELTFFVTLGCLIVFMLLLVYGKEKYYFGIIVAVSFLLSILNVKSFPTKLSFEKEYNSSYEFFEELEENNISLNNIYTNLGRIQFVLLGRRVYMLDDEKIDEVDVAVVNNAKEDLFVSNGFYKVAIDNNELLFVRDPELYKTLAKFNNEEVSLDTDTEESFED